MSAEKLESLFCKLTAFKEAKSIAGYMAFKNEISVLPILHHALKLGKNCFLPKIPTGDSKKLLFSSFNVDTKFKFNKFGIKEPTGSCIEPTNIDLIIVPLVAYDLNGNRLGMGGGYYDATFKNVDSSKLVGVGYDFQQVTSVPIEEHDLKLKIIVTDQKVIEL